MRPALRRPGARAHRNRPDKRQISGHRYGPGPPRRVPSMGPRRGVPVVVGHAALRRTRVALIAGVLAIGWSAGAGPFGLRAVVASPAPTRRHRGGSIGRRHGPVSRAGSRGGRRRPPVHQRRHGAVLPERHVAGRPCRPPGRQRRHLHGPRQRLAEPAPRLAVPGDARTGSGSTRAPAATTRTTSTSARPPSGRRSAWPRTRSSCSTTCATPAASPSPGVPEGSLDIARQRVDNFAAGFIRAGASAVIADAYASPTAYLAAILGGRRSIDSTWRQRAERQRARVRVR